MASISFNTTIRPGLLVAVTGSIKGNVKYKKEDIQAEHVVDGEAKAEWNTKRTIKNPVEFKAAQEVMSKASYMIKSVCSRIGTMPVYVCPNIAAPDLDKAVIEAKALCEAFNQTATVTKIRLGVVTGKVAQDDVQAVRAIRREVSELLNDMKEGIESLDVATVREAASRAKQLGQMLAPEAEARVRVAIEQARALATRINKAGEQGAAEIDARTIAVLTEARTAFLDLDDVEEIGQGFVAGRAVDLTPNSDKVSAAPAAPATSARAMDL